MTTIKFEAHIKVGDECIWADTIHAVDVMKIGQKIKGPVMRRYNKALREAPKDSIVYGYYHGQNKFPPYQSYSGSISGVNGKVMRRDGGLECDN